MIFLSLKHANNANYRKLFARLKAAVGKEILALGGGDMGLDLTITSEFPKLPPLRMTSKRRRAAAKSR